jgi:hypothetical protein
MGTYRAAYSMLLFSLFEAEIADGNRFISVRIIFENQTKFKKLSTVLLPKYANTSHVGNDIAPKLSPVSNPDVFSQCGNAELR